MDEEEIKTLIDNLQEIDYKYDNLDDIMFDVVIALHEENWVSGKEKIGQALSLMIILHHNTNKVIDYLEKIIKDKTNKT